MASTVEQILLKLGIDQSQVGPGLADFKMKVNETIHSIHRDFHKFQEQVKDSSGAAATAIRAFFSPVGAAVMGAAAAYAYLTRQVEELNKRLDEQAEIAAKPMVNYREAVKKAAEEVDRAAAAEKKWEVDFASRHEKAKQSLEREIELLKIRGAYVDKAIDQEKSRQKDIRNAGLEAAVRSGSMLPETAAELRRQSDARSEYDANQAKGQFRVGELNKFLAGNSTAMQSAWNAVMDANAAADDPRAALRRAQLSGELSRNKSDIEKAHDDLIIAKVQEAASGGYGLHNDEYQRIRDPKVAQAMADFSNSPGSRVDKLNAELKRLTLESDKATKALEELEKAHSADTDAVEKAKTRFDELDKLQQQKTNEKNSIQAQLALPFNGPGAVPFTPSYAQPSFSDYLNTKGPYQNIAQRLNSNEEAAKYWSIQGRPDIAQQYIQANEGRDVMVNRMGEEVSGDELAFESRGSYFGIHQEHRPGLRDRLPKPQGGGTSEKDYLAMIQKDIEALRQSGCGPETVSDGLKIIPADVR